MSDRESPILAQCIRPAQAMAVRLAQCRPHEVYGLPPPPPPPASSRRGMDMAVAWQRGDASLERIGLALALTRDYRLSRAVLAGARVGYLGIPGSALAAGGNGTAAPRAGNFHALELAARARLRLGVLGHRFRPELEAHLGYRLALSAGDHAAGGVGLYLAWRRFGMGLRYARAFEDAAPVHTVLLVTERNSLVEDARDGHTRHPRVGLGLHAIAAGWGFAEGLGYMLPGVAVELPVDFGVQPLVAVARWDFLWFPGIGAESLTAQAMLGGLQWWKLGPLPLGVSATAGYGLTQGDTPRAVEAGPIADLGVWYWLGDDALGWHLGLHGRLGLATSSRDLRALYLSIGGRQIF